MLRPTCLVLGSLVMLSGAMNFAARADAGQTVVVVLDDSGSMDRRMSNGQRRIVAAKEALSAVMRGLRHDTSVGVLALNSKVNGSPWIVPVGSPDASRWQQLVSSVNAKGGTPLGHVMRVAGDELLRLRATQPYETFRMLVVTDGEATDAPLLNSILPDLMSRGISMDVIGVDMKADHSLARLSHSYRRAGDRASLEQALTEVLAETAVDDQTNQADFDLIAGLSEETASAIVQGLAAPRNDPIQEFDPSASRQPSEPAQSTAGPSNVQPASPGAPNLGSTPPARVSRSLWATGVSFVFGGVCCLGSFGIVVVLMVVIILNAVKNNTRS